MLIDRLTEETNLNSSHASQKGWVCMTIPKSVLMAEADGIKYHKIGKNEAKRQCDIYVFEIPCEECGKIYEQRWVYRSDDRHVCPYCKEIGKKRIKAAKQTLINAVYTPGEQRFFKAKEQYLQQVKNAKNRDRAVAAAEKACEKFGSIPEAMVGIELIRLGYRIYPQHKIGQYHVDFAIPDQKLIVEVDGSLYHSDKAKLLQRDAAIGYIIGFDWVIVHIPADLIKKDITKTKSCIDAMLQHRGKK